MDLLFSFLNPCESVFIGGSSFFLFYIFYIVEDRHPSL